MFTDWFWKAWEALEDPGLKDPVFLPPTENDDNLEDPLSDLAGIGIGFLIASMW